jgi:hypothetical protein
MSDLVRTIVCNSLGETATTLDPVILDYIVGVLADHDSFEIDEGNLESIISPYLIDTCSEIQIREICRKMLKSLTCSEGGNNHSMKVPKRGTTKDNSLVPLKAKINIRDMNKSEKDEKEEEEILRQYQQVIGTTKLSFSNNNKKDKKNPKNKHLKRTHGHRAK